MCALFLLQNLLLTSLWIIKKCVFIKLYCNGCIIVFWDRNRKCIYYDISLLKYLWLDLLNLKPIFNCWIMLNEFCIFDMWIKILIYTLDYYYYIISSIRYGDCNEVKIIYVDHHMILDLVYMWCIEIYICLFYIGYNIIIII